MSMIMSYFEYIDLLISSTRAGGPGLRDAGHQCADGQAARRAVVGAGARQAQAQQVQAVW